MPTDSHEVLRLADFDLEQLIGFLAQFQLELELCSPDKPIPDSFWGDDEAGLRDHRLFARPDTPLHSILHEASHFICASPQRRNGLRRDAGSDDTEECAVCYLQVLLADELPGLDRERMFADMDCWGYSFRLGSTRAWFESDAGDARSWLSNHGLLSGGKPTFSLRQS